MRRKLTPDSSIGLIFLSRRIDFEAVMLLHSNVITRIQIVSVLSRDLLNTKPKFLVPLNILQVDGMYSKLIRPYSSSNLSDQNYAN